MNADIVSNDVFYGRYWGQLREKEVKNLHFETCYWAAIEYCIKLKIKRMEPGAGGGGEHSSKLSQWATQSNLSSFSVVTQTTNGLAASIQL
jgi:predicted N-acyltransferase